MDGMSWTLPAAAAADNTVVDVDDCLSLMQADSAHGTAADAFAAADAAVADRHFAGTGQ